MICIINRGAIDDRNDWISRKELFFPCNLSNDLPIIHVRWIKSKYLENKYIFDWKIRPKTREACSMKWRKSNIAPVILRANDRRTISVTHPKCEESGRQRGFPLIPLFRRRARVQNKAATRSSWLEGEKFQLQNGCIPPVRR